MKWISIEDRLPEYGQHIVVYVWNGKFSCFAVATTYFKGFPYNVKYWLPLPNPPEVKDDKPI